jgi:hypothetical protein
MVSKVIEVQHGLVGDILQPAAALGKHLQVVWKMSLLYTCIRRQIYMCMYECMCVCACVCVYRVFIFISSLSLSLSLSLYIYNIYIYRVFIGSAETGLTDIRAKGSRHALSRRMAKTQRGVRRGVEADVAARSGRLGCRFSRPPFAPQVAAHFVHRGIQGVEVSWSGLSLSH